MLHRQMQIINMFPKFKIMRSVYVQVIPLSKGLGFIILL